MSDQTLFSPLKLGALDLPHRVLMAPLTRNRAHPDGTPADLAVEYYRQRASAGLIITEATQISAEGKGYINTPGIHGDAHVKAWKKITDAVHEAGGRIALQLWHVGRISHTSLLPNGESPVAPSAIRANSQTFTENGPTDVSEPRALALSEIPRLIEEYRKAAERAKEAGFDMVEVHAANGYLLDQFIQDKTNTRDDAYGGSAENRVRLMKEVVEAVAEVWGADHVGVRLSPLGQFNDMGDSDPEATFTAAYKALNGLGLAYLHVVEKFPGSQPTSEEGAILDRLRTHWAGTYIANGDFDAETANAWIKKGRADGITFGRPFISNPDLPERFKRGAPLTEPDQSTFYGGDHHGYTDYPSLEEAA